MSTPTRSLTGLLINLFFVLVTLGSAGILAAQTPILPVQQTTGRLPMLGEAIRDPKVLRNEVRDDLQASAIKRDIAEAKADLSRAKGARQRDLIRSLLSNYAALVAYYEDVLNGTLSKEGNPVTTGDLSAARGAMIQYAAAYAKVAASKNQVAQARYHYHTQKYVLNSGRSRAIATLKKLNHLDGYLKRRAELVIALHELDHGNASTQARAKSQLIRLIRPLHLEGAIVARLALARKEAGLNSQGRKYLRADKKYRSYLYQASKRSVRLGESLKRAVLVYSVGIWRAAEGRRAEWDSVPLHLASFGDMKAVHGIQERQAISYWRNKNYNRAAAMYDQLSSKYADQPQQILLDMRILDIRASEYAHTDRSRNYELALQKMLTKYNGKEAHRRAIRARYEKLVEQETRLALNTKTNRSKRSEVITLLARYMDRLEDQQQRLKYEETTGDLHALNGDHQKAVGVYLDMIMNRDASNKGSLYKKAVASQRVLANWPSDTPWSGVTAGHDMERTQLLTIQKEQLKLYGKAKSPEWHILAHVGLLEINLGDSSSAFKRWEAAMTSSPSQHPDARQAAGFMIEVYNRTQNWAGQERIARICLKTGLQPLRGTQSFNLPALLAEALLNGGRELLEAGKPTPAREKLAEFVAKFKKHQRHDEGQFFLAHAYRGEGNHKKSISTLVDLTKTHPGSTYYSQALILGGDWGFAMALEEETIYFHQLYVEKFAQGKETPRIRDGLITLYEGRELIGQASALLEAQAQDRRLAHTRRLKAALDMLDLEERFGGNDKAYRASELILALAKSEVGAKAKALAFQVRFYNEKRDLQRMQQLEAKISKLGGSTETDSALAEARFYIALYVAQVQRDEIHSVALPNPLKTLNEEYKHYLRIKKVFDRVCSAGESGYCAPAMLEVSAIADNMKVRIDEITIAEDFDKKTVDGFTHRKRSILTTLENHHNSYRLKANQVVRRGNTNPTYTEQVLWENSNDWNFDRITGEVGNGYIQFSPNLVIAE